MSFSIIKRIPFYKKMSPQPLSGNDFKLKNVQNSDIDPIWPYFPKYGNLGSKPQKLRFFENSFFYHQKNFIFQNISPQPLSGNDFNSIWLYFPKYGNLGSDPQNLSIFEFFFYHQKNSILQKMSPQPISSDHFLLKYLSFTIFCRSGSTVPQRFELPTAPLTTDICSCTKE